VPERLATAHLGSDDSLAVVIEIATRSRHLVLAAFTNSAYFPRGVESRNATVSIL